MAIATDAFGFARVNTVGAASTVTLAAAEANEVAVIYIWNDAAATPTVTVNGVSATQVGTGINITGTQYIRAFYFANPPTSSVNYVGTTVGGKTEIHVLLYKGGKQTGIPDSFNSQTGGLSPQTISTTVVATGCWLVSMSRDYDTGVNNASTGTTLRNAGIGAASGDSNGTVGTGSQGMTWTGNDGASHLGQFIVSIAPDAVVVVASNRLALLGVG